MDSQPPLIASFIIRFVLNEMQHEPSQPAYRGSIRHIQSDNELHFHLWEDAVDFIQRYVPLDEGRDAFPGKPAGSEST